MQTIVSDTWKPGFFNDGDGNYVRQTITERSDNPRQMTRQESRDGWAPGFYYDGEGLYERMTSVTRKPHDGQTVIVQRDSWAPGYTHDGAGRYTRIIHNDQGAQTAAMPDQDQ